ncbi:MAG TPA: vWA domain-containing protein [Gaiellaceae bacterium]|jgi:hypothetical protein
MRTDAPIPSIDALAFRGARARTRVLQAALALACLALLVFAVYTATSLNAPAESVIPQGRSGVIVLDISRSIGVVPARLVRKALKRLDSPEERVGLVVFSDTAYEILPPGSPGSELDSIIRFFQPVKGRTYHGQPIFPVSPWDETFRSGTQISTGLRAGWDALRRDHIRNGALVLISDLADEADDVEGLVQLVLTMEREHVDLKILPLDPTAVNRNLFARLAGKDAFVGDAPSVGVGGVVHGIDSALRRPLPWALIGLSVALLLALAVNEALCGKLQVPSREPA